MNKIGRITACIVVMTLGVITGNAILDGIANVNWDTVFKVSVTQSMGVIFYALIWEKS